MSGVEFDEKRWKARNDKDTLTEADRIRKSPSRMKAIELLVDEEMEALSTLSNREFNDLKQQMS